MATADFWRTFHHDGKISSGWWGWGVHAHLLSLHLPSRFHVQSCSVYAPAEWADTLILFHLYPYMYSVDNTTWIRRLGQDGETTRSIRATTLWQRWHSMLIEKMRNYNPIPQVASGGGQRWRPAAAAIGKTSQTATSGGRTVKYVWGESGALNIGHTRVFYRRHSCKGLQKGRWGGRRRQEDYSKFVSCSSQSWI